jgi:hypothetical protein
MQALLPLTILPAILAGCSDPEIPLGFLSRENLDALPHAETVEITPATGKPAKQIKDSRQATWKDTELGVMYRPCIEFPGMSGKD